MLCVAGAGNDRVQCPPLFIQRPKLLIPHRRAVVDVVSERRVVKVTLFHILTRQAAGEVFVGIGAPAAVVLVFGNPFFVVARRRHPVIEKSIVLAAKGSRLCSGVTAGYECSVCRNIVSMASAVCRADRVDVLVGST